LGAAGNEAVGEALTSKQSKIEICSITLDNTYGVVFAVDAQTCTLNYMDPENKPITTEV
jgi:hypothetical protein